MIVMTLSLKLSRCLVNLHKLVEREMMTRAKSAKSALN